MDVPRPSDTRTRDTGSWPAGRRRAGPPGGRPSPRGPRTPSGCGGKCSRRPGTRARPRQVPGPGHADPPQLSQNLPALRGPDSSPPAKQRPPAPRSPRGARPTGLERGPGPPTGRPLPAQNSTREPACGDPGGEIGKTRTWRPYVQAFRAAAAVAVAAVAAVAAATKRFQIRAGAEVAASQQARGGGRSRLGGGTGGGAQLAGPAPFPKPLAAARGAVAMATLRASAAPPSRPGTGTSALAFPRPPGRAAPLRWRRYGPLLPLPSRSGAGTSALAFPRPPALGGVVMATSRPSAQLPARFPAWRPLDQSQAETPGMTRPRTGRCCLQTSRSDK